MGPDAKYIKKITGFRTRCVKSCASTFDEIGNYDAIIARSQKRGAGRGEHTFHSPLGGLYIVMRLSSLAIDAHTLTPAVGLAVHDTIKNVLGVDTRLKWVNDVMADGKKVCGILCRSPRRGEYLIGIGINYATTQFALENAGLDNAATLNAPEEKVNAFCAELLRRIHLYALAKFDHARYNALCDTVGKDISFVKDGVTVRGFAENVETDGTLIVRIGMATVAVDSGEVSIIREEAK
ncbi:MAG: biotin--[acetyl-CoA-carboxylase] ligase [Clostridiales bacterium]|nr:biotin--[acetyl-CoA-carboxylase] ligase [Clostridiales bacterium]